jgi:hypothetical protein
MPDSPGEAWSFLVESHNDETGEDFHYWAHTDETNDDWDWWNGYLDSLAEMYEAAGYGSTE